MKRILVPTDFSLPARWAAEAASDIAKKSGAELIFLHVIEQPTSQSFSVQGQIDESDGWEERLYTFKLIEKSSEDLHAWADDFRSSNLKIRPILRVGNTFHGITTAILQESVDLIVMGTTGKTTLENVFLGSNTDRVVRLSRCPVLTIHMKPATKEYRNIVYATSLNDNETSFAQVIKVAQQLYGATVHLVRINTPSNFRPDLEVTQLLKRFVHKMDFNRYTINIFNDLTAEEGIVHFAESIKADLIGMATHSRSGFMHVLAGSVAEEVTNHSERPVLTYVTPHPGKR